MQPGDRARSSRASGPTGCSSTATRTRRSPARGPRSRPACRSRTSRPACAAATSSMPEERNRIEVDRLAALLLCPDERSRGDPRGARASPGRIEVVGDVMADASLAPRAARARALARRSRALGRRARRYVARHDPPRGERAAGAALGRILDGLGADRRSRSSSPRTRARGRRSSARPRARRRTSALARAARLPRLRRARLAGAGDRHRLGRAPEGGVLVRRAVRDRCGPRPSGSTRSRPARTCSSTTTPTRSPRPSRARACPPERAAALRRRPRRRARIAARSWLRSRRPVSAHRDSRRRRHRRRRLRRRAARADVRRGGHARRPRRRRRRSASTRLNRGESHIEDVPSRDARARSSRAGRRARRPTTTCCATPTRS